MDNKRIDSLTGIRGIAALWVLFHHLVTQYPLQGKLPHWVLNIADKGWLGVDLFFVLSGFVIAYVHHKDFALGVTRPSWQRFMLLRIARVYPVHLFTTLALVPIVLAAQALFDYQSFVDAFSSTKMLFSLTLTNGIGIPDSLGWNAPSWSVSSEFFAYLCFPLLALFLFKRQLALVECLLIILALFSFTVALGWGVSGFESYFAGWQWVGLRVISEFTFGMVLFQLYRLKLNLRFDFLATLAVVIIVVMSVVNTHSRWDWVMILAFGLLVYVLAQPSNWVSRGLSRRLAVYLGEVSYSIYLCHGVVFMVLNQVLQKLMPDVSGVELMVPIVVYLVVTLVVAYCTYRWVEVPAQRWIKSRFISATQRSAPQGSKI